MSSLGGGLSPGDRPPWGPGPRSAGPGGAPAGAGKTSSRPAPGAGSGGPGPGAGRGLERDAGPGVLAAAAPASRPLAVFLPRAPGPGPSRCGTRCQVALAAGASRFPLVTARASRSLPVSDPCSLTSVPVPRVISISRPLSGDTAGGRLKPVDRSRVPVLTITLGQREWESHLCSSTPCPPPAPTKSRTSGVWEERRGTPFVFQSGCFIL